MTTRRSPYGGEPFRLSDGLRQGLGRGALNGPRFARPFHGVREWVGDGELDPDDHEKLSPTERRRREFARRCRQFATRMGDNDFFSHGTALVLRGAPTPHDWDEAIHVSAVRPRNPARTRGVVSHRLAPREPAFRRVGGLRVEDPVRAWVQSSSYLPDIELTIAADFLVARRRRLASIEQLRAEAAAMRRPGLQPVLDRVRDGAESPWETRLRLALVDGGLPEPWLAYELRGPDGTFVARLDQAYPEYRVAVEYDGRQHAEDAGQFARDADRWQQIADLEWRLVRILHHHLYPDPAAAVERVRRALAKAGWTG